MTILTYLAIIYVLLDDYILNVPKLLEELS